MATLKDVRDALNQSWGSDYLRTLSRNTVRPQDCPAGTVSPLNSLVLTIGCQERTVHVFDAFPRQTIGYGVHGTSIMPDEELANSYRTA